MRAAHHSNQDGAEQARESDATSLSPDLPIAIGTHSFRQSYLYGFATQAEITQHVRTQAVAEEVARLPEIIDAWTNLRSTIAALEATQVGLAEAIQITDLPASVAPKLRVIADDPLFRKTFGLLACSFAMVEIDKLIAPQRTINLDYADRLAAGYPRQPTFDDLVEICLAPRRKMDAIQHLEVAPNSHIFSSPNSDMRFLGAFMKQLTADDLTYAEMGGIPVAAVIGFVGYGGSPVNVLLSGKRCVLNNGFHRVWTLRSLGVARIPVVVQHARNPRLEFPPAVCGLPREYLLGAPRPALLGDFFDPRLRVELRVRERLKMVGLQFGVSEHGVPA